VSDIASADELAELSPIVQQPSDHLPADPNGAVPADVIAESAAEDVVSSLSREIAWVGRCFWRRDAPSWFYRFLQLVPVVIFVDNVFFIGFGGVAGDVPGMDGPNALVYISNMLLNATFLCTLGVLHAVLITVRPASGMAFELGVGTKTVSRSDARSLKRWRICQRLVASFFIWFMGRFAVSVATEPMVRAEWATPARAVLLCGWVMLMGVLMPVVFAIFWPTMRTASAVVRNDAVRTIEAVKQADVSDTAAWSRVEQQALQLHRSMQALSAGFGPGLMAMGGFCWLWALAFFCNAINTPFHTGQDEKVRRDVERMGESAENPFGSNQNGYLIFVCILTPLPLLVAMDIAATSTQMDELMEALNEKAIAAGFKQDTAANFETHTRVDWLETRLKRTNFSQGIGFRIGDKIRYSTGAHCAASAFGWSASLAPSSPR